MATQKDYRPQLSLAERDRRYRAVRAGMAERGFDVLLAPANSGRWEQLQADARYLSQIGGNATETFVALPREGEPTAFVMNRAASRRHLAAPPRPASGSSRRKSGGSACRPVRHCDCPTVPGSTS